MSRELVQTLLKQLKYLTSILHISDWKLLEVIKSWITKLMSNQHVADLIKYVFLGSIIETGRQAGSAVLDWAKHFFVYEASLVRGDFAYDWVTRYLADKQIWSTSRIFRVGVQNPADISPSAKESSYNYKDGRPVQSYQPRPEAPVLFNWKGHWITVNLGDPSYSLESHEYGSSITLSVWSRNRKILDQFIEDARQHYFMSPQPPRQLLVLPDRSGSILTVRFRQGDRSYDWMLAWIRAHDTFEHATHLDITTLPGELSVNPETSQRDLVAYKPAKGSKQRVYWNGHWFQFDVSEDGDPSEFRYRYDDSSRNGTIDITVHNSNRSIMTELVAAAYDEYLLHTMSKVTVHLADSSGGWSSKVTKSRRSLQTIILPEGVKEMLLSDIQEFLGSSEWYAWGGLPHRRGYLLYGEPGTGKSSTIHAVASELGMEIYYVQLSSRSLDDMQLRRLFSQAPSRCIILLEDIDCAFTSSRRNNQDEEVVQILPDGRPIYNQEPTSSVTLSGLLNCLDSVISEEGRVVFATTNHIEKLDPALIRPGRMDIKIEYCLASHYQIHHTFMRFYKLKPTQKVADIAQPETTDISQDQDLEELSRKFTEKIPEGKFSLAQIQEYLIRKRHDPIRAIEDVEEWMLTQEEEAKRRGELLQEVEKPQTNGEAEIVDNGGINDESSSIVAMIEAS